jgi:hypothetical protein
MATTSDTHPGNGSNKLFSITFPYLDTSDIDVYLNGTLQTITTHYTFANATTVEFVAAPANGAVILLDRNTNDSDASATFFPGSSIKAADLNDNFKQVLFLAQETNNNVANAVAGQIPDGTITSAKIADGTITSAKIADDTITSAKIADDTITSAKIADGAIVNADVNASAGIVATKLAFTQSGAGATVRTVDSKLKDVVSVKDFGAVGDGVADDTAAIQAAITASTSIVFPAGTYKTISSISIPSNRVLVGVNARITWDADVFLTCFTLTGVTDIDITGLEFQATTSATVREPYAISALNVRRLNISQCLTTNSNLLYAWHSGANYAAAVFSETAGGFNCNTGIRIKNCDITGSGSSSQLYGWGIIMGYTAHWTISNCVVRTCGNGITWWGGDSNPAVDGALANERKCRYGSVVGCSVYDISGGGIWGSMGQNISVGSNSINNTSDVGIDFEGCFDSVATGNSVNDCVNGCLATFHYNRNVAFNGNSVWSTNANNTLVKLYNVGLNTNNSNVSFVGNTFSYNNGNNLGIVGDMGGTCANVLFANNQLLNTKIQFTATNNTGTSVLNNTLKFTANNTFTAFAAIAVKAQGTDQSVISGNTLFNAVQQNGGSSFISCETGDFNFPTNVIISNNVSCKTIGTSSYAFSYDVTTTESGTNAGVSGSYVIKNNTFAGTTKWLRTESGSGQSIVKLYDNVDESGNYWPSAALTSFPIDAGTQYINSAPTSGGFIGGVATTTGNPATWKTFGVIS